MSWVWYLSRCARDTIEQDRHRFLFILLCLSRSHADKPIQINDGDIRNLHCSSKLAFKVYDSPNRNGIDSDKADTTSCRVCIPSVVS